jgi:hypothetical protein
MCSNARGSGAFCDIERCVFMLSQSECNIHNVLSVKPGCKASGGEIRSENVDMSSDKEGERPSRRKSKGSCLKLI